MCVELKKIYRTSDFYLMEVRDVFGQYLGYINGVNLNINEKIVDGFSLCCKGIKNEMKKIDTRDVITFNEVMIISDKSKNTGMTFNKIRGMEVYDLQSNLLGKVEEIYFDFIHYKIMAIILGTGFFRDIFKGKQVLLMNNLIVGDDNILILEKQEKIEFYSRVHGI